MRAGALVSPCHVMAGLVPAIHVFARSSTDLAERDARNKSGHDERSGRTGETARLTQSHANFRIGTLARLSNQGCGLRGDFWPHREGNGLPPASKGRPAPSMGDGRPFSSTRDRLSHKSRTAQRYGGGSQPRRGRTVCPEGPNEASDIVESRRTCRRSRGIRLPPVRRSVGGEESSRSSLPRRRLRWCRPIVQLTPPSCHMVPLSGVGPSSVRTNPTHC